MIFPDNLFPGGPHWRGAPCLWRPISLLPVEWRAEKVRRQARIWVAAVYGGPLGSLVSGLLSWIRRESISGIDGQTPPTEAVCSV